MREIIAAAATALVLAIGAPAQAQWKTWEDVDPMTGDVRRGAQSSFTEPMSPMGFPYHDVVAIAVLSCGARLSFWFDGLNLRGGENHDGYRTFRLRVKFDGNPPVKRHFAQNWGSNLLYYSGRLYLHEMRESVLASKSMLLELPWHGQGDVVFKFDLTGSREAYGEACSGD